MPTDQPLGLGVDLGSSGVRAALVSSDGAVLAWSQLPYCGEFDRAEVWRQTFCAVVAALPASLRRQAVAIGLDGTSGTLLACGQDGHPLAPALAYNVACPDQAAAAAALVPDGGSAATAGGSLARALHLLANLGGPLWLRHQADWLMGWLMDDWRWGEEGNNQRLGWDPVQRCWSGTIAHQPWADALPAIVPSNTILGSLTPAIAASLGLETDVRVVSGTTDGTATALAANPGPHDGVTVLGTTTVLKQLADSPRSGPGISSHRVGDRWLVGGASNAGAGVLLQFFGIDQLDELSRSIDWRQPSGLRLRPLPGRGERFPVNDPTLEPVLGPRPVGDARYLQALLEGLTEVERLGWEQLQTLGLPAPQRILTVGGGARNPIWRHLREQALGLPVRNLPDAWAAAAMGRLALQSLGGEAPDWSGTSASP
jgi:sugar (pentulose or hexulose) kinase